MNLVAILSLLLVTGQAVLAENTYAAFVPKYIRPGVEYSIDIELLEHPGTIVVDAKLMSDDYSSSATAQISPEARTANLAFLTVPYGYDGSTDFNVTIVGKDSETGAKVFSNETKNIQFQKKFLSIFIQTDKAIYQPGHTIKFRAVVVTPELLPYGGKVSYRLEDPSGNIILKQSNAQLTQGVVGSEFKLGRYSTLGDWKIFYEVHGYEESISVSVEEYKLPKFSVDLKTDQSFLHPGSEVLTGELSATYTFGQPVRGTAVLEVSVNKWWGPNRKAPKIVIQYPEFDGSEPFEIEVRKIESVLEWNPKSWSTPLTIKANVTDKNTGEMYQETTTVDLRQVKMKVETLAKPDHIKPGLPYVAYLKISQQDGSNLDAQDLEDLRVEIHVTYSYAYNWTLDEQKQAKTDIVKVTVGPDGLIVFKTIASADDFNNVNFNVKIPTYPNKDQHWTSWSAKRFKSPSNTFLQVSTDDTTLAAGDTAKLTIYTTEKSHLYRISLLARGKVMMNELYQPTMYDDKETYSLFNYSFTVKTEYSPSVFAVVSFVRDDGEFIADTVKINVQAALNNEVTLTALPNKTDAGMPVSITVHADAGSFVGLRAIDQSVLLLKSGNDITRAKIFQDLEKYGPTGGSGTYPRWGGWWWPYSVGGADVSEVFENSGFIVLSDGIVYQAEPEFVSGCRETIHGTVCAGVAMRPEQPMQSTVERTSSTGVLVPTKTRNFFPETWIWAEADIGDNGSVTFNYNVPDTITTWELSSFAVSDNKGLGVTKENSKITVFRNFFISLDLPPSMVRGEVLKMKTTVFNYFDQELTATVTLTDNDWYDVIPIEKMAGPAGVRTITIPSKDSVTVIFSIEFKKVGNAPIMIRAVSVLAADEVQRTLRVKPEGIPKIVSHSNIIDRQHENEPATLLNFEVDIPKDAVEGSAYVKFSVSGNILGNALSNVGNLLQMPSGCGEQTMLSFAPDVYISLYLKRVGDLTGDIKQKSEGHIREGYQNELRYQRDDGSFSAFGPTDRSGSTWLTAFVAKCFIAANELNPDLIEEKKIEQAVNFILGQQNNDGTFEEPGRIIHKEMQGGVDSDDTTAAYMLIALTEGGTFKKNEDIQLAIAKTQRFLEGRIDQIQDIYTLSLVGYALSLVESAEAGNVLGIIDLMAKTQANVKYWEKAETGAAKCDEKVDYCPFDSDQSSSSSVEMTAYVLLTYIKLGRTNEVMPIVRWLIQQRGASGGYHSTQDTVMAIQALSTVAGIFSDRTLDLDINVAHSGNEDFGALFFLSDENAMVLQMVDLPSVPGNVTVTGTGQGFADVQVTVGYNLPVGPKNDEPFVVVVKVKKVVDQVKMEVCSRINEDREEVINGTGMYVVTFTLPSGYTVDGKKATRDNHDTKLIEVVGEEVTGYFDELPRGLTLCMTLELIRYAEVDGIKPKLLRAYDYYSPKIVAQTMVKMPPNEDCPCCVPDSDVPCCECPPVVITLDCGTETYPCPDFYDGLFYDSSSHIQRLITTYPEGNPCRAPQLAGDSRLFSGLPASRLDGVKQYIECSNTPHFEAMLRNLNGWTISIVVHPMEITREKLLTIFSIASKEANRPYVILAKRPRSTQFWLKILLNGKQMIVRGIRDSDILVNQTSLITARLDGSVPSLFVNGIKRGRFTSRGQKTEDLEGEITLKVGRSHVGGKVTRGNFKGLVSSLDAWLKPLTDEEILAHYNYWQASITAKNPSLDVAKVKHSVPPSIRKCFEKAYYSEELKSLAGDLRTDCDEPNGPPPPHQM